MAPQTPDVADEATQIGQHAQLLSVAALRVLAALRFDGGDVSDLVWKVRHEITELASIVEHIDVSAPEPDALVLAARAVLRSALLAVRATLAAVADGSWGGGPFDLAERACSDLVRDQEEFARQFELRAGAAS